MTPERWQQIDQLFHAAIVYEPAQRADFLVRACDGDESLRLEVESLVSSHQEAESFIETPPGDLAAGLLHSHGPAFQPGQQIENYRIVRQLGAGGMGEVYLADDLRLKRKVALKLLPPHFTVNPDRVSRFEREARAASALNHPNILTIYEIGQTNDAHFIATEFVDGKTLRQLINEKPFTLSETLNVAIQVADALAGAHAAGIIHRDIKPENIMVRQDGYVKVLDFGLAKLTELHASDSDLESSTLLQSNPGLIMGTVQYMSPEQARGKKVDAGTDIWSIGIVLYELLSGQVPFSGDTASHVMVSLMEDALPPLTDHAIVPAELDRIVTRALRKNQKERYQTAMQLARELKNLKRELQVEARLKGIVDVVPSRTTGAQSPLANRSATGTVTLQSQRTFTRSTSSAEYLFNQIKRYKRSALLAGAAVTVAVAAVGYVYFTRGKSPVAIDEAIDSVAVLPFVNVNNDPNTEYLSDGISDSVISRLTRLPNLRVISLGTVARYKGKQIDPQAVGRELNVRAVLVGRMTQQGDGLVISTELVDVRDNRRLWDGQYNRPRSDVLAVQREIAAEIAEKLRLRLDSSEKGTLTKQYTRSAEAYDAYARGSFLLDKRNSKDTKKSIEYFELAIKLDPNYALAYAALSYAYWSLVEVPALNHEVMAKARAAVAKALEIDGTLAEAHTALGHIRITDLDWAGAEAAFKRATELNPNSGFAHSNYAIYLMPMKRFEEAIAESKRAVELEPTSISYNRNVAMNLYMSRRYDEAIAQCEKTLELDPNMPTTHWWLGEAYEQKGLQDQAFAAHLRHEELSGTEAAPLREAYAGRGWGGFWRKLLDLKKEQADKRNISSYKFAEIYMRLKEKDQAFYWLEKAHQERLRTAKFLNVDPQWDELRSDPRYANLVRRMGLEP